MVHTGLTALKFFDFYCKKDPENCGKFLGGEKPSDFVRKVWDKELMREELSCTPLLSLYGWPVPDQPVPGVSGLLMKVILSGIFFPQQNIRAFIPAVVYRLNRCSLDDQKVLGFMIYFLMQLLGGTQLGMSPEQVEVWAEAGRKAWFPPLTDAATGRPYAYVPPPRTAGASSGFSTMIRILIGASELDSYPLPSMNTGVSWFIDSVLASGAFQGYNTTKEW